MTRMKKDIRFEKANMITKISVSGMKIHYMIECFKEREAP